MKCEICKKREAYRVIMLPTDTVSELCQLCDIALTAKILRFCYGKTLAKAHIVKYIRKVLGA